MRAWVSGDTARTTERASLRRIVDDAVGCLTWALAFPTPGVAMNRYISECSKVCCEVRPWLSGISKVTAFTGGSFTRNGQRRWDGNSSLPILSMGASPGPWVGGSWFSLSVAMGGFYPWDGRSGRICRGDIKRRSGPKGREGRTEEPRPSPMGAGGDPGEPVVDGIIIDKQLGDTLFKM